MKRIQIAGIAFSVLVGLFISQSASAQSIRAYVANFNDDSVSVINTDQNVIQEKIPVGEGPSQVVNNSDCTLAFVGNRVGGSVSVINTGLRTVIETIDLAGDPTLNQLVISPDDQTLYVGAFNPDVLHIFDISDINNIILITQIPLAVGPQGMDITPDGNRLYVALVSDLLAIDTNTNSVTDTIPLPGINDPDSVVVSPDGQRVYVMLGAGATNGGFIISTATIR